MSFEGTGADACTGVVVFGAVGATCTGVTLSVAGPALCGGLVLGVTGLGGVRDVPLGTVGADVGRVMLFPVACLNIESISSCGN